MIARIKSIAVLLLGNSPVDPRLDSASIMQMDASISVLEIRDSERQD